eukprot:TRINITY_DN9733_c0_g1_i1.p1 TRINITY_DN9733_c0_g1~~TRINITY_DN9733_c0_g1_i1.p1  ORF type:complete len:778 (+),score=147.20 TRINITY_DN9733_c0_g1_i1:96-2336(+)
MPAAGMPGLTPAIPASGNDELDALQVITSVLGCELTAEMSKDPQQSLFAEASRLLLAVLGFMCEGACPPMLRGTVVTRAVHNPVWHGVVPHALLREWFDGARLLGIFGETVLRKCFEAATRSAQGQFIAMLSRAASVEVQRPGMDRSLRFGWQKVFENFPEVGLFRSLLTHVRRRCWEDARDRSRSRSRSRDKKKRKTDVPKNADEIRFFIKQISQLTEDALGYHFQNYGKIISCNVLMDKKTKKSREMGFVTLAPEGTWKGKKATRQDVIDWVLSEKHNIAGVSVEVTVAEDKAVEDEQKKRDERVEERRRARLEKEERMSRTVGVAAHLVDRGTEKLVPSPWHKRWRHDLWEHLPKGTVPAPWSDARVEKVCSAIWSEAAEHAGRTGDETIKKALALFKDHKSSGNTRWSFVPAADMLLIVGEGIVGITALGVFTAQQFLEPTSPSGIHAIVSLAVPTFAAPIPVQPVVQTPVPIAPNLTFSANPGEGRMHKGNSDECKVFVGGLTPATTLDQFMSYFSQYGRITDAVVMADKLTGKPRGFGFVVFEYMDNVDAVIRDYAKHRIDGKWVEVKRASPEALNPVKTQAPQPVGALNAGLGPVQPALMAPGACSVPVRSNSSPPNSGQVPAVSPPSFSAVPPPSFSAVPPPSFSAVPPPSFSAVPPPSFSAVPPPSFSAVPPPSGQGSCSDMKAPGQGLLAQLSQAKLEDPASQAVAGASRRTFAEHTGEMRQRLVSEDVYDPLANP